MKSTEFKFLQAHRRPIIRRLRRCLPAAPEKRKTNHQALYINENGKPNQQKQKSLLHRQQSRETSQRATRAASACLKITSSTSIDCKPRLDYIRHLQKRPSPPVPRIDQLRKWPVPTPGLQRLQKRPQPATRIRHLRKGPSPPPPRKHQASP